MNARKWFVDDVDLDAADPDWVCIGEFDTKDEAEAFAKSRSRPGKPLPSGGYRMPWTPVVFAADPEFIRQRDAGRILANALQARASS